MKKINLLKILESKYCKGTFLISLIMATLITPAKIFYSWYTIIAVLFILTFSLTTTCTIRNIKDKTKTLIHQKKSIISIIAAILGISALQVCTIGAPVCTAASVGILAIIIPKFAISILSKYSVSIISLSIIIQIAALISMKCFKVSQHLKQKKN